MLGQKIYFKFCHDHEGHLTANVLYIHPRYKSFNFLICSWPELASIRAPFCNAALCVTIQQYCIPERFAITSIVGHS